MATKRFAFLLLIGVCFNACKGDLTDGIETTSYIYDLAKVDDIVIPISDSSSYLPRRMGLYEIDGSEYLVTENEGTTALEVYSIDSKRLVKNIRLSKTGPNSVKCLKGFHPLSLDSFLIFCPDAYKITLVNDQGTPLDAYNWITDPKVRKEPEKHGVSIPHMLAGNMGIMRADTLYVPAVTLADYADPNAFSEFHSSQWFHFGAKQSDFVYKYPSTYREKNFNHLSTQIFRTLNDQGNFVYSFQADPNLYETNLHGQDIAHKASSLHLPDPEPIPTRHENTVPSDMTKYAALSSSFKHVLYDKYRKVYYRVLEGPGKVTASLRTAHYDSKISIIILDQDFQVIGETELPFQKYTYRNIFVSRAGLCISKGHPMRENPDEDTMSFGVFELVEI